MDSKKLSRIDINNPMMIFVVGAHSRRFLPVVYIALLESAVVILATYYCSFSGIIEMVITAKKHGYGYAGPNEASMQYLFFLMMYFFSRYYLEKKKGVEYRESGETGGLNLNEIDVRKFDQNGKSDIADRILNVVDEVVLSIGLKFIVSYSSSRVSIVCWLILVVGIAIYKFSKLNPIEKWNESAIKIVDMFFFSTFVPTYVYVAAFSFMSSYFLIKKTIRLDIGYRESF